MLAATLAAVTSFEVILLGEYQEALIGEVVIGGIKIFSHLLNAGANFAFSWQ